MAKKKSKAQLQAAAIPAPERSNMKKKSEHFRQVNITLPPAMVEALCEITNTRMDRPTVTQVIREACTMYLEALEPESPEGT